ncbi:hypothetical protein DFH28DRAFT_877314, partial [Melampsora americana]
AQSPHNNLNSNAPQLYHYPAGFCFYPVTSTNHQEAYPANGISLNHTVYPPRIGTHPANYTYTNPPMNPLAREFLPQSYLSPQPVVNHVTHSNTTEFLSAPQSLSTDYIDIQSPASLPMHQYLETSKHHSSSSAHISSSTTINISLLTDNNESQINHGQHDEINHQDINEDIDGEWEPDEDE